MKRSFVPGSDGTWSITVGSTISHKGSNKIKSIGSYKLTDIGDLIFSCELIGAFHEKNIY